MKYLVLVSVLLGCDLYLPHHQPIPDPLDARGGAPHPDAATSQNDPACGNVDCGQGRHCEVQCSQYGPVSCSYNCHVTCMPDMPCSEVTTCAPGTQCYDSCLNGCQAMADLCDQMCGTPDDSCEWITTEADCNARSDCRALYKATGCSCAGVPDTCTCTNEQASFVRCASTMIPG